MAYIGEGYTPAEKTKPRQLAKLPPSPPFQYAHHPKGWQIMWNDKGGAVLLPRLSKIFLRPGTNHIGNDMDLTECRMRFEADGWRFVPFDLAGKVDKGAKSYIQRVPVAGGEAFLSRWCRVVPGTSRTMSDGTGWRRFLSAVAKFVGPPQAWALDDLKSRYERRRSEIARSANVIPDSDEQIARCDDAIKVITRELKKAEARDMSAGDEVIPDAVD